MNVKTMVVVAVLSLENVLAAAEVISLNFGSDYGAVEGPGADGALVPGVVADSWNNYTEKTATDIAVTNAWDGVSVWTLSGVTASWSSFGTYFMNNYAAVIQKGYLNDWTTKGVNISVSGIDTLFSSYSVILYYSTDSKEYSFSAPCVNETYYTCDNSGVVSEGSAQWGSGNVYSVQLGQNAIRIDGLSGDLSIYTGGMVAEPTCRRGSLGALQIVNTGDPVRQLSGSSIAVSRVNETLADSASSRLRIVLDAGASLVFDEPIVFPDDLEKLTFASSGDLVLLKRGGVADADLSDVEFDVKGVLKRSASQVVSINFNSDKGIADDSRFGLAGYDGEGSWNNTTEKSANGLPGSVFWDGVESCELTAVSVGWDCFSLYNFNSYAMPFQKGHLCDWETKDVSISVSGIGSLFSEYSVLIYYSTDSPDYVFSAPSVNGVSYTSDALGVVSEGTAAWGTGNIYTAEFGKNVLRIDGLSGSLNIRGGGMVVAEKRRASIAAIQIVNTGDPVASIRVSGSNVMISQLNAAIAAMAVPSVRIGLDDDATLTFDTDLVKPTAIGKVAIVKHGDLVLLKEGGVRAADLAAVSFDVDGTVRPASETISFNFGSSTAAVSGSGPDGALAGYVVADSWNNLEHFAGADEPVTTYFDGCVVRHDADLKFSWEGHNLASWSKYAAPFQKGYIDDFIQDAATKSIKISLGKIPYSEYSVLIYYVTDSPSYRFPAPTVNGVRYRAKEDGTTEIGTDPWGNGADYSVGLGKNVIRVDGLTSRWLRIDGGKFVNNVTRGSIAAIQVVNTGCRVQPQGLLLMMQ